MQGIREAAMGKKEKKPQYKEKYNPYENYGIYDDYYDYDPYKTCYEKEDNYGMFDKKTFDKKDGEIKIEITVPTNKKLENKTYYEQEEKAKQTAYDKIKEIMKKDFEQNYIMTLTTLPGLGETDVTIILTPTNQ